TDTTTAPLLLVSGHVGVATIDARATTGTSAGAPEVFEQRETYHYIGDHHDKRLSSSCWSRPLARSDVLWPGHSSSCKVKTTSSGMPPARVQKLQLVAARETHKLTQAHVDHHFRARRARH